MFSLARKKPSLKDVRRRDLIGSVPEFGSVGVPPWGLWDPRGAQRAIDAKGCMPERSAGVRYFTAVSITYMDEMAEGMGFEPTIRC